MSRAHTIQALAALPYIGERLATRMVEELGVGSVAELVDAALAHQLQALRGIGSRREQQILEAARAAIPSGTLDHVLRCPGCGHDGIDLESAFAECPVCHREYTIDHGVVDLMGSGGGSRSVTQRIMETRFYARFYEDVMRPRLSNSDGTPRGRAPLAARWLELETARSVLDVACGTGAFTRQFSRRVPDGALVVGIDISWPMLETARTYLRKEELHDAVHLLRADTSRLPLRTESFDRLHCAGALHIMDDVDEALLEFARVLEPGGVCVVSTFVTPGGFVRRALKRVTRIASRLRLFSPGELQRRMTRAGFSVLKEDVQGDTLTVKAFRQP